MTADGARERVILALLEEREVRRDAVQHYLECIGSERGGDEYARERLARAFGFTGDPEAKR